ncbi:protein STRUBBELIG-RECEPTOR FAMILY 6-like [Primulina huaijiensis]|uniref:protein STRUBBELIG-RECEPTOR FAMILY 6-like n=1 Tax=Primulina huaijiensis TaxID=1492673 RepID=UPI003CC6E4FD
MRREVEGPMATAVLFIGILVFGLSSSNASTDPSDVSALNTMYSGLHSPQQLTKWNLSGGDPCGDSWKGIKCSGTRVTEIKLSGLGLSGELGYQLASLTSVTTFDVSNNNLGSSFPYFLPANAEQLNLAGCGLNGRLSYYISEMTSLKSIDVSHNQLQGQLSTDFSKLSALSTLDLSSNAFTGDLPQSFGALSSITDMYLQDNQLTGTIDVLSNLPLKNLNVENNHFSGWIPEELKGINLHSKGNSWNSGPAPPPPPGTPPASRPNRNNNSGGTGGSSNAGSKSGIGAGAIAGIVVSVSIVGAIVAFFIIRRRSRRSAMDIEKLDNNRAFSPLASQEAQGTFQSAEMKPVQTSSTDSMKIFETPIVINLRPPPADRAKSFDESDATAKPIVPMKKVSTASINAKLYSVADLQIATDSFSVENLIGEGSVGRVYQAQLDDGKVAAVKKINSSALPNSKDFLEIVSDISRLHHPNITELVGYCTEHGQNLLIYEFYKNGSLHEFLHLSDEYVKPLSWNNRVKIALGTARALEYLHEVCSPSVVHKNFKSSNILLDAELNPHLSDCGLAENLIYEPDQASGYLAPEVFLSGQYTIKSDVYCFGVVMLELVTGRKPFDRSRPRSEQSLARWATPLLHDIDALSKMVDPALKGLFPVKSLSRFADAIALCVQPEPEFRPPMSEVVEALVRLVQRSSMSKRTFGNEGTPRGETEDS